MFTKKIVNNHINASRAVFSDPLSSASKIIGLHKIQNLRIKKDSFFDFDFADMWKFLLQVLKCSSIIQTVDKVIHLTKLDM
jgi:hypothetical protein